MPSVEAADQVETTSSPFDTSAMPEPLQTVIGRMPRLASLVYFGWRLAERWGKDECPLKAASMAFFGLLSVFPIVLAVIAILGQTLIGNQDVLERFTAYVAQFFPGAAGEVLGEIKNIAASTNAGTLSIIGILSLLWSGRAFFDTLAAVLNSIWPNTQPRSFLQQQLALWSTFLGAGVLWLLSTGTTFALSAARTLSERLPDVFDRYQPLLWSLLPRFTSWLLTVVMFWLIYWLLPNRQEKSRRRIVLGAALVAALGWEVAKFAFTEFLGNVARYQSIYGSVAGVIMTLMWIYFSSMILLLGAEAAGAFEETCAAIEDRPSATNVDPQITDNPRTADDPRHEAQEPSSPEPSEIEPPDKAWSHNNNFGKLNTKRNPVSELFVLLTLVFLVLLKLGQRHRGKAEQ